MGQAKQRGTFEERKTAAIERNRLREKESILARIKIEREMQERRSNTLARMMIPFIMGMSTPTTRRR